MEFSDEELCRQVAGGDAVAFDALVERYQARAYRLACSILGNEADARDVSQDAFIRLYEAAGRFDERSKFSTWFHRILVNLCIDHQRRNRWWRKMVPIGKRDDDPDAPEIDFPSDAPGPDVEVIQGESAGRLRGALDKLSANQRAAVLMQAEEGFTSREIAQVLGCSEATARVHVHRGIAALKKILKGEEP